MENHWLIFAPSTIHNGYFKHTDRSRPMRRDYGSRLFQRLDAPLTGDLVAEIYSDVVEALFNYEPRIKVTAVTVTELIPGKIVLTLDGVYIPTGEIININGITIQ